MESTQVPAPYKDRSTGLIGPRHPLGLCRLVIIPAGPARLVADPDRHVRLRPVQRLTYSRHGVLEMYRLMDFPPAQIDQIQKSGLLTGNFFMWLSALFLLPFLGNLFFIRRYFRRSS
jgi:hypothetical protein